MNEPQRFGELWTSYLEGELDESRLAELTTLLEADDDLVRQAADLFQSHRLLGLACQNEPQRQDDFVRHTMAALPVNQGEFVNKVMSRVESTVTTPRARSSADGPMSADLRKQTFTRSLPPVSYLVVAVAAVVLVAVGAFALRFQNADVAKQDPGKRNPQQIVDAAARGNVRLASIFQAKFFGELSPPVNSSLTLHREYVLTSGLIEVAFPTGASAILEGPAVFRVTSDESLALDVGHCSLHAPDGAEGFRIDTPATQIVDRGTRFSVKVGETSETEVQVIEGAADVYDRARQANGATDSEVRLQIGEAKSFAAAGAFKTSDVAFDSTVYRRGLPDRVVSYEATEAADGRAENLTGITIQRGGRLFSMAVEDLIPVRLHWFKATSARGYICGGVSLPDSRVDVVSDHSLVTGVINPDGNQEPLNSDPVMEGPAGTPGMALYFERPVHNGPGADVVFFDLQTFGNPADGDAFHVSPLSFRDGLRSHTIRRYDLTMESPEVRELTNFHVHFFAEAADSISMLEESKLVSQQQAIRFRALAVGIDLSDLGYADGEAVPGLFFQDADDDQHLVDPVFIGGLPEIK